MGRHQKFTLENCRMLAVEKHGDAYDYSRTTNFVNSVTKIDIRHKLCDRWFTQSWHCHAVRGQGCPHCDASKKTNTTSFIEKCKKLEHYKDYGYDYVDYVNSATKVQIDCLRCNCQFGITPNNFLRRKGCPRCSGKFVDTQGFIERSKKIFFMDTFGYECTEYTGQYSSLSITCNSCQEDFSIKPYHHYKGYGCPRCRLSVNDTLISQKEMDWLDELEIPMIFRQQSLKAGKYTFRPDACVDNVIYEYYGSYYHGDPRYMKRDKFIKQIRKTAGEQYDWTMWREKCLKQAGYEIKFVWELDHDSGLMFSEKHPTYTPWI